MRFSFCAHTLQCLTFRFVIIHCINNKLRQFNFSKDFTKQSSDTWCQSWRRMTGKQSKLAIAKKRENVLITNLIEQCNVLLVLLFTLYLTPPIERKVHIIRKQSMKEFDHNNCNNWLCRNFYHWMVWRAARGSVQIHQRWRPQTWRKAKVSINHWHNTLFIVSKRNAKLLNRISFIHSFKIFSHNAVCMAFHEDCIFFTP